MTQRKIIVHIAMSADGYIARTDGDIDWLTARPAPAGLAVRPFIGASGWLLRNRSIQEINRHESARPEKL